jgi:hypothetical protein
VEFEMPDSTRGRYPTANCYAVILPV